MKAAEFSIWCLLFAGVSVAMPGMRRRQAQTDCTCPASGPVTTTVAQYTVMTYSTTVTSQDGTVYSTDSATQVVTVSSTTTITVTTGTTTITDPGVTQTTTTLSTTTSTITTTVTQSSCAAGASRKVKRQDSSSTSSSESSATSGSGTNGPSVITTIATSSSRGYTCICRSISSPTTLASTSSCQCPATTETTITTTADYTSTSIVTTVTTTPYVLTVTPSVTSTTIISSYVTATDVSTVETTPDPVTVTSTSIATEYTTFTSTVYTCPPSSTTASSSSSTTSAAATASASGSLVCNSTAYLIETTNSIPQLYNIDLRTSTSFVINNNVGAGKYTNINGMGYNVLDNFLYAIGTISSSSYAVLRISSTGSVTEVLQFTSSTTSPGSSGDVDTDGQFWFAGSGGTVWRQVDLAPGSSTYGTIVASGSSTLSGYSVYDWVYLPNQGSYLYSLATSTDSSPNYAVLRWSQSAHTWSVYQEYQSVSAPNSVIANWGAPNATIWGLAATSGQTTRVTLGGTPVAIGTAPSGLTSADGARCALAA